MWTIPHTYQPNALNLGDGPFLHTATYIESIVAVQVLTYLKQSLRHRQLEAPPSHVAGIEV
jgi:hypothetical protein